MIYPRERSDAQRDFMILAPLIVSYLSRRSSQSTKDRKDNEARRGKREGERGMRRRSRDECKVERNAAKVERGKEAEDGGAGRGWKILGRTTSVASPAVAAPILILGRGRSSRRGRATSMGS